jgi:hypothetical protein
MLGLLKFQAEFAHTPFNWLKMEDGSRLALTRDRRGGIPPLPSPLRLSAASAASAVPLTDLTPLHSPGGLRPVLPTVIGNSLSLPNSHNSPNSWFPSSTSPALCVPPRPPRLRGYFHQLPSPSCASCSSWFPPWRIPFPPIQSAVVAAARIRPGPRFSVVWICQRIKN